MELASELPGPFSEWATKGIESSDEELAYLKGMLAERIGVDQSEGDIHGRVGYGSGMQLVVELSPQPDPPGLVRWVFRLWSVEAQPSSVNGSGTPLPAPGSGQGFLEGYLASVRGEQFDPATGLWTPICEDILLPAATESATPSTEAPPAGAMVTVLQPANCRLGPGMVYAIATSFVQGRALPITGRSEIGVWWQISYTRTPGACWIAGNVVEPAGDLSGVPIVVAPPTPTPTEPPPPLQQTNQGCLHNGVCHPWVCGPQHNDPPSAQPCTY